MPLYLAAALLPFLPGAASIAAAAGGWAGVTASIVSASTPNALLYSAACAVVAAPLAGVAVAVRARGALEITRQIGILTGIFCAVSAVLTAARLGTEPGAIEFVATSHAVLASATLALAALGALLGSFFRDPLDAAAIGVGLAVTAAFGVLVAGAPVAEMPAPLLKAALLVSPVMTVATAAHVDLVRSDLWYQVSPLAHIRLEYPDWITVCGTYLLAGCAGFFATAWCRAPRGPAHERGR